MLADCLHTFWATTWVEHPQLIFTGMICALCFYSAMGMTQKKTHILFQAVEKRIYAWAYLFKGSSIVSHGFNQSHGEPFEVYAPDTRMVFVSSPEHIKELDNTPDTVLSLNGAAKHMLQPVYTMNGFNWFDR